jgi:hypothetical protein
VQGEQGVGLENFDQLVPIVELQTDRGVAVGRESGPLFAVDVDHKGRAVPPLAARLALGPHGVFDGFQLVFR